MKRSSRASSFVVLLTLTAFASSAFGAQPTKPRPTPSPQIKLEDLGFKTRDAQANPELQGQLQSRESMLGLHQTMAFVTWGLMATTVLLSEKAKESSTHQRLGALTGVSYFTTAYLSMGAPDPLHASGTTGLNIKIHKILRWIHLPLMILMPIAGLQANDAVKHGKADYGLGKYKTQMGALAFASYTLAGSVMLFEF